MYFTPYQNVFHTCSPGHPPFGLPLDRVCRSKCRCKCRNPTMAINPKLCHGKLKPCVQMVRVISERQPTCHTTLMRHRCDSGAKPVTQAQACCAEEQANDMKNTKGQYAKLSQLEQNARRINMAAHLLITLS